jgi:predicted  nucleic acid-binding Zn-ribbon protein
MNLADLIQKHVKEIDAAAREASRMTRRDVDSERPAKMFDARVKRVDARIAQLEAQRAESEKRFVGAIVEQKKLRQDMLKEAEVWTKRVRTKTAPKRASRATADPKARKSTATVKSTPSGTRPKGPARSKK